MLKCKRIYNFPLVADLDMSQRGSTVLAVWHPHISFIYMVPFSCVELTQQESSAMARQQLDNEHKSLLALANDNHPLLVMIHCWIMRWNQRSVMPPYTFKTQNICGLRVSANEWLVMVLPFGWSYHLSVGLSLIPYVCTVTNLNNEPKSHKWRMAFWLVI